MPRASGLLWHPKGFDPVKASNKLLSDSSAVSTVNEWHYYSFSWKSDGGSLSVAVDGHVAAVTKGYETGHKLPLGPSTLSLVSETPYSIL